MTHGAADDRTVAEPWALPGNLAAEVHETHTGLVTLLGPWAYKTKKPVRTDEAENAGRSAPGTSCVPAHLQGNGVRR